MKQKHICHAFLLFAVLMSVPLLLTTSCCREERHPKGIKHVVVIGIDAMSVQGFLEASTPCMDSMMHNGAYNYKVRCVLPTVSKPNWNAMLCGAGPEATGVIDNSWNRSFDEFPPVTMSEHKIFPNIFSVIREQMPNAETGCISQWSGFKDILETELMNRFETYPTHMETARKTAEYILDKKPDFVFIQLDEVDDVGHSKGHMSAEYIKTIHDIDGDVRVIVNAVKKAGISDNTMIMVVADHGGIFYRHGQNTYEELTTPIIYSGKGIKKGYQIKQQIYKYDVAADVAFSLGLKRPQQWLGRPVIAAYESFNEPANIYSGTEILPPPVFLSKEAKPVRGSIYGYLSIDTAAVVVLKSPMGVNGEIRYTIDGTIPTRESSLYSAPVALNNSAIVKAKIFGKNGESPMVSAQYRVASSKKGNGINYSFFSFSGIKEKPSFNSKPVNMGICYEIGLNTPGINNLKKIYHTDYGMCFTGWIKIDSGGNYTFRIWSDGAYKLLINSFLVIENNNLDGSNSAGSIKLDKGIYPFRAEYFTHEKSGSLDIYYESKDMPIRFIPGDKLFREKK
jgi:hypothetical protein